MKRESDIYQLITYIISLFLVGAQQAVEFMDTHTGAIGGGLGFATFCLNWYFQAKRLKFDMKKLEQDAKD